ncbi:unnamed protein product [Owenia fusiformis]|uniref:Uncharacterized protein n=1 Tax=Owenia fusiformis TaxID=6347 RepID=A0A8J1UT75_OWEFU|nr:unnamed protein product [Owenia fusiformis]
MTLASFSVMLMVALPIVMSYPGGPPEGSCVDMFPSGHAAIAQKGAAPFLLEINEGGYYTPGKPVKVTMRNTSEIWFEGVFLQARRASPSLNQNQALGNFTVTDNELKTMRCIKRESAVTQSNKVHKFQKQVQWNPPEGLKDHIFFRATFVQETKIFWVDVRSIDLEYRSPQVQNKNNNNKSTATMPTMQTFSTLLIMFSKLLI